MYIRRARPTHVRNSYESKERITSISMYDVCIINNKDNDKIKQTININIVIKTKQTKQTALFIDCRRVDDLFQVQV